MLDDIGDSRPPAKAPAGANHWLNIDPDLCFADARLGDLLRYWEGKRRGRIMPARGDIDPFELRPHLGRLILIDVAHDPFRLRYRLIGTTITETLGRDMTGRYFDEIYPPDILADALASFEWIAVNRKPLRLHGDTIYADKAMYAFEIVNLPLSADGACVNMVLGALIFSLSGTD